MAQCLIGDPKAFYTKMDKTAGGYKRKFLGLLVRPRIVDRVLMAVKGRILDRIEMDVYSNWCI